MSWLQVLELQYESSLARYRAEGGNALLYMAQYWFDQIRREKASLRHAGKPAKPATGSGGRPAVLILPDPIKPGPTGAAVKLPSHQYDAVLTPDPSRVDPPRKREAPVVELPF